MIPWYLVSFLTVALLSSGWSYAATENQTGYYLWQIPGRSVAYLSLNDTGQAITGYSERIEASATAPDGQFRKQTFVRRNGATLLVGASCITRVPRGYEMTTTMQDGHIEQMLFVRASPAAVNASIVALSASVSQKRSLIDRQSVATELRSYSLISADDSRRLTVAQAGVQSAALLLRGAQLSADRYSAIARQARSLANAKIDEPGVSFEQNQSRMSAMEAADAAEREVVVAQHAADVAGVAVNSAIADVARLRDHLAALGRRAEALSAHGSTDAISRR